MSIAIDPDCVPYLDILHDAYEYIPKRAIRFFLEGEEDRISALIAEMESVIAHPEEFQEEGSRVLYFGTLILAALHREEGISLIQKIGYWESDWIDLFVGDYLFDSFTLAIAELYTYRIGDLKMLIEDEKVDPAIRAASLQALMILFGRRIIHRDDVVAYFKGLLEKRSEKIPYFYEVLASASFALHPEEMIEPLRLAYKEGFIDSKEISLTDIEELLPLPKEQMIEQSRDALATQLSDLIAHFDVAHKQFEFPERNDPCPCGSGLKFKKCCH